MTGPQDSYAGRSRFHAVSPLDGRYRDETEVLPAYFSEFALMRMRCVVELRFLRALAATGLFPALSAAESGRIDSALESFNDDDLAEIKTIESRIHHDVKACEVFLRNRLGLSNPNMLHFGLTSEDINNLAYSLLIAEFVSHQQLLLLAHLIAELCRKAVAWRDVAFVARTHGQAASPSTLGKEMAVFVDRLLRQHDQLQSFPFRGKATGATGTFAAWHVVFPDYDWLEFSRRFIRDLGLEPALATTQIEDHDTWAAYFALVGRINGIVRDLDTDVWLYQTLGYLGEAAVEGEVGSSTMPHKVNPIRFENSEGNLKVSDALLSMMSRELTHSRLQRDLSDSTVTRNVGVALSHAHLAWTQTVRGLQRLEACQSRCDADLDAHPELLAEPLQTILRAEGVADPYEMLRRFMRGRSVTLQDIHDFILSLPVSGEVKDRLRSLRVRAYVGYAPVICDLVLDDARARLGREVVP